MATAQTHVEMHGEHRHWLSDNAMWRDDLTLWQKEIDHALESVKKLENTLRDHRKKLQSHLDTVATEEKALKDHEHVLAEFERGTPGKEIDLLVMAKTHGKTATEHTQHLQAHERMKKEHHTMLAHWSLLIHAITHSA